ncbi:MAG TPA: ACT domain-containing protein [Candidatus Limnocylindrales bacterium]|nr:ACT domain-containing protein [Candidatus Limnocylindrales bacterium]
MNAFLIELENKPGSLARVGEVLAARNINITSMAGVTCGGSGRLIMTTDNPRATSEALGGAGIGFDDRELTVASMPNVPGTLAVAARRLADAGINVEALLPLGMQGNDIMAGVVTDQPARTRELLAQAGATT